MAFLLVVFLFRSVSAFPLDSADKMISSIALTLRNVLAVGDEVHHVLAHLDVVLLAGLLDVGPLGECSFNLLGEVLGVEGGDHLYGHTT